MKNQKLFNFFLGLGILLFLTKCKDSGSELKPDEENELITTVKLNFTNKTDGTVISFMFQDKDGDGGNAATRYDTIQLAKYSEYSLTLEFLDESKKPSDDITAEIKEKSDEHLIIVTPNPVNILTYKYDDQDTNGFPVGLQGIVTTGNIGKGSLKIQLRHQPGTKNGTAEPGSDDVNLDFQLMIN